MQSKKSSRGFTLIELMIVVAVVGILTAIAVPSYMEYVRRGHRADARAGLQQAQLWLERVATATGTYPATAAFPTTLTWSADASKRYQISYVPTPAPAPFTGYTLTATRKSTGAQATDRCGDYTLTHTGVRGANNLSGGATVAECWNR